MAEDLQKRKTGGNFPVGDSGLLIGSLFAVLIAATGFACVLWIQSLTVTRFGIVTPLMLAPAFLFGSLKDCWKLGWTWKRSVAIGFCLIALAFETLALHETFAQSSFFKSL